MAEEYAFQHPQPQSNNKPAFDQIAGEQATTQVLQSQLQALQQRVQQLQNTRVNLNTDLIGFFESLTAAPTGVPISPYGQVKLARISGTTYLYIYDYNNPTLGSGSNGWMRVALG